MTCASEKPTVHQESKSMISSHEERILDAIRQGHVRPAQLVRVTCLGVEQVKTILSKLRKSRRVEKVDGEFRIPGSDVQDQS
jgi:predicted Rossmann fold nucleotide-binding protein DprA/Smf involved in DNA uptake